MAKGKLGNFRTSNVELAVTLPQGIHKPDFSLMIHSPLHLKDSSSGTFQKCDVCVCVRLLQGLHDTNDSTRFTTFHLDLYRYTVQILFD